MKPGKKKQAYGRVFFEGRTGSIARGFLIKILPLSFC